MRSTLRAAVMFTAILSTTGMSLPSSGASAGLYPDIRTIVPKQLQIVNAHQREFLRFSNGIVNTGAGHWRMRPEVVPSGNDVVQRAVQEILDASGKVVHHEVVSEFAYHPDHDHWHIDRVALFQIRTGSPTGPIVGGNSVKVTFCLIDWYKLDDNPAFPERSYFHCGAERQGLSPGWVDQYRHSVEGQELDITGIAPGDYYLVSTSNPDGNFLETDTGNNSAWVQFRLSRPSQGNARLEILGNSPCGSPGLCGEQKTNR